MSGSSRPQFDLKESLLYCKENSEAGFPESQILWAGMTERKTDSTMPSETVSEGLKTYSIGNKLRRLRLRKSMGLVELGKHTGLSPALLSKLERDVMYPTLPTLLRIAMVFSVGLEYFFNPEPKPVLAIVRRKERLRFPDAADAKQPSYHFESLDFPVAGRKLDAYYAEFETADPAHARPHQHDGVEFLYVLQGKLLLTVGKDDYELAEADAIYFDATVPHAYRRAGARRTSALVVTAPK
jgi:transcriptional regulator with XRE-family HTH domain